MNIIGEAFVPHFYFYVSVIHELGVLIPYTPFEADFLRSLTQPLLRLL